MKGIVVDGAGARSVARRALITVLALVLLAAGGPSQAEEHCATKPPPEGLVERCHSKLFWFPSSLSDAFRRSYLEVILIEWMRTCVMEERAVALVYEDEEGLDKLFKLLKDLAPERFVKIVPVYTPLTFTQDGRTCYGVKSVSFSVPAARAEVDADGEIEIISGPTSDMIKEAASAAMQALKDPSVQASASLSRFLSVLQALATYGNDFDDTWYNVQPYNTGDPFNSVACYKGPAGCASPAEALAACERHLAQELVQSYHYDKVSPRRYAEILEIKAADIQRSIDHLAAIQGQDSRGAVPCSSIETVFMPRIAELARRHSLYSVGEY